MEGTFSALIAMMAANPWLLIPLLVSAEIEWGGKGRPRVRFRFGRLGVLVPLVETLARGIGQLSGRRPAPPSKTS